jgi:hypothetical protein
VTVILRVWPNRDQALSFDERLAEARRQLRDAAWGRIADEALARWVDRQLGRMA